MAQRNQIIRIYWMAQRTLLNTLMTYMGKESKKEWIYVYQIRFAILLRLTRCKATTVRLKKIFF